MSAQHLRPVEHDEDLPVYPFGPETRLDSHWFMTWNRQRWLNSNMALCGTWESKAMYFELINIAFDQSPIGTLHSDHRLLAKLIRVDVDHFRALCSMDFGPLHNWRRCRSGDHIRLYHPVIVETLRTSLALREDNRAKTDAASRAKRLQRLRMWVGSFDTKLMENDTAIAWMDRFLVEAGVQKRTEDRLRGALTAWVEHIQSGRRR